MPTHITLETFMNLKRKGFQQIAMYRDNTTANIGFCASGAEGITIGILFFTQLQFRLDKHR